MDGSCPAATTRGETVDAGVSDDLWSLAWFAGKLYVLDRGKLIPVKMGKDRPNAMAFDGKKWTRID